MMNVASITAIWRTTTLTLLIITIAAALSAKPQTIMEYDPSLESYHIEVSQQHVTTDKSMKVIMQNTFNSSIFFGVEYSFTKLVNGYWERFPSEPIWIMPLFERLPGDVFTQNIDLLGFTSGKYRVSKMVALGDFRSDEIEVYAEFTVERPPINPNGVPAYGYYPMVTMIAESSSESPDYPMMELYNHGGLVLALPGEFKVERKERGEWVTVYSEPDAGSIMKLLPGDTFQEIWGFKYVEGSYRYSREIFAEGYVNPIHFEFSWG